jgi:ribulose bisphosphate carboxylase small subunit
MYEWTEANKEQIRNVVNQGYNVGCELPPIDIPEKTKEFLNWINNNGFELNREEGESFRNWIFIRKPKKLT